MTAIPPWRAFLSPSMAANEKAREVRAFYCMDFRVSLQLRELLSCARKKLGAGLKCLAQYLGDGVPELR